MRHAIPLFAAALLALPGCASRHDPARQQQAASLVNSLTWTDAVTGKADALRSSWPFDTLNQHAERFPLAQVKRCDAAGASSWGVLDARRTITAPRYVKGGVAFDIELTLNVGRRHEALPGGEKVAMAIPADVPALEAKRTHRQSLVLEYGKVQRLDFDHGIGYDVCVQRLDAARQPVEQCPIPYQ
ncbi:MAG: hypothetical protein ACXWVD_15130 [Telluria sp.]